jgi:hypothetical protein
MMSFYEPFSPNWYADVAFKLLCKCALAAGKCNFVAFQGPISESSFEEERGVWIAVCGQATVHNFVHVYIIVEVQWINEPIQL